MLMLHCVIVAGLAGTRSVTSVMQVKVVYGLPVLCSPFRLFFFGITETAVINNQQLYFKQENQEMAEKERGQGSLTC